MVTVTEALEGLLPAERRRLEHQFEQGTCAISRVRKTDFFVGCHVDQMPHMRIVSSEGKWSICAKEND